MVKERTKTYISLRKKTDRKRLTLEKKLADFIITIQFLINKLSLAQFYLFCGRKLLESGTVALVREQIKECFLSCLNNCFVNGHYI